MEASYDIRRIVFIFLYEKRRIFKWQNLEELE